MYVEVSVEPADRLQVVATGYGAELPRDESHLAARVAAKVVGHDRLRVAVHSDIPVGRGLGSSAALAVAAAAAAGASQPFLYGVEVDGHPENAAASSFGGLVVAADVGGTPISRHLELDPGLRFVALIPEVELLTSAARAALPDVVSRQDVIFNLGRMGLLIAGLADRSQLVAAAGDDRIHQGPRSALFPQAPALLAGLREAGALTSFWSGAGSTILAVCDQEVAPQVAGSAEQLLLVHSVPGQVRVLEADNGGITLLGG
jgi:homoserine kinase